MREIGLNVVRIYHFAAALVSRSMRCGRSARADHPAVGKAHRVSARDDRRATQIVRMVARRREDERRASGNLWLSGWKRDLEHDGALARRPARDRIRRGTHPHRARDRSGRSVFLRDVIRRRNICSRRMSISFASTFICTTSAISNVTCLRLQNLTEERPLILGEFGMDTIRHSQEEQAEMLGWHVDSVVKCGLAGTIFFAWTDEWFTGGQEITDWAFGIVTRERAAEEGVLHACGETWAGRFRRCRIVPLPRTPFVSVIVCSYNGGTHSCAPASSR